MVRLPIISDEVREAAVYFGKFVEGKQGDLDEIIERAKKIPPIEGRPGPSVVYHFSESIRAHLAWTFRSTSFPDGFTSPAKFAAAVEFFRDWLSTTASAVLEEEKKVIGGHANLADRLLRFIREFDDAASFVLQFMPDNRPPKAISDVISSMSASFVAVHGNLQHRHAGRSTLTIVDEYDVQDLYSSMLRIFESDILLEEPIPSNGARRSRADMLLTGHRTIIEFKMTRNGLSEKDLTDQLMLDCASYQRHPNCDFIHFFIYDPGGRIRNEVALERALSGPHVSGSSSRSVMVSCTVVR